VILTVRQQIERKSGMKFIASTAAVLLLIATVAYAQINKDKPWELEDTWPVYIQNHPISLEAKDGDSTRLLKKRFNVTLEELRHRYTYWEARECQLQDVFDNVDRLELARETHPEGIGRPTTLNEQRLDFAKYLEMRANPQKRPVQRNIDFVDAKRAEGFRLSIEVEQLQK